MSTPEERKEHVRHYYKDLLQRAADIGCEASAICRTYGRNDPERYEKELEDFSRAVLEIRRSLAEILADDDIF